MRQSPGFVAHPSQSLSNPLFDGRSIHGLFTLSTKCLCATVHNMTPKQAIAHWTNQATLATALGVSKQVVHNWKQRKRIPLRWQLVLNELSLGELKVDGAMRSNGGKS